MIPVPDAGAWREPESRPPQMSWPTFPLPCPCTRVRFGNRASLIAHYILHTLDEGKHRVPLHSCTSVAFHLSFYVQWGRLKDSLATVFLLRDALQQNMRPRLRRSSCSHPCLMNVRSTSSP